MASSPEAVQPQGSPVRPSTAAARSGGTSKDDDAVAVRVAVHIRPLVENELAKGCQEILDVTPNSAQIAVGQHTFTYDNVYGSGGGDSAANLYPDCVQPLVDGLFKGYNATVFAYGQTGSGKTFTMGSAWRPDEDNQGVIPSVMDELFTRVEAEPHTDFTIKVSFVEIHKEEVRDLLWANTSAPRPVVTIRELPSGVSLAGASERLVHSREEMSHVLMQGTLMRAVAATNMNNRSSRSHAIFTISLEQRRRQLIRPASAPAAVECTPGGTPLQDNSRSSSDDDDDEGDDEDEEQESEVGDEYLIAKMHLVDLAGSERAKRTGAEGARLREAININKGLLALAKVITALVDGQSHVPYRDSKLTRLLQDSLGGNSRTVMIACVSPADINREETLNTLRYADRARRIKNKPVVNRDPMAAQLAALRQQIAGLRAENLALRTALGGDKEAAAALAAASRAGQNVASEALQEAYDDLALRCNGLEVENAKQQIELESATAEVQLLRTGLLAAETQRDHLVLRLQALQQAAAASSDLSVKEALVQDAAAAEAAAASPSRSVSPQQPGSTAAASASRSPAADKATASLPTAAAADKVSGDEAQVAAAATTEQAVAGLAAEVGIVTSLRARVAELEAELRQVRSLQRMTSSALARGMSVSQSGLRSRPASSSGGLGSRAASTTVALPPRPGSRLGSLFSIGSHSMNGTASVVTIGEGYHLDECGEGDAIMSPVTPARPSGLEGGDLLGEPLMEVAPDAEMLAQSAAHMMAREAMTLKLEVIARQMEAKQKRLLALQSAADIAGAKGKYMVELQKERDALAKEKTALLQKLAAVTQASAEERKRLEQSYKEKLTAVERRLKELAEREKAAKRSAAQLGRVQSVCQQLQADIARMKAARASVQRRMESKEKEFREWRLLREREVLQLRRNAQRQNAALQQHQAMHSKQQAVLKRKTEEAEAARRKLRDLLELQARVKRDKQHASHGGSGSDPVGAGAIDVELQPNASAPLLRTGKARREWIEQEMELCSTSWQYQKVLDGELAQRADATRKLREVQKQLMLLGGLVPPSPVVTAAAAAAAAGRRSSGNGPSGPAVLPEEDVLLKEAKRLQEATIRHTQSIQELQEQWERARAEEQSRGAGAADVRRWTGIRNIIEAREMLRTLFISACAQRAQVHESQIELAKLQESNDILEIRLDMAVQQAAEAKRKALEAEATTAAVITTPAHQLALAAAAAAATSSSSDDSGDEAAAAGPDGVTAESPLQRSRRRRLQQLIKSSSSMGRSAAAANSRSEAAPVPAAVADMLGQLGGVGAAAAAVIAATPERVASVHNAAGIAAIMAPEDRDDVDIEADNLLHSMGLPPIQELPSPGAAESEAQDQGASSSGQQPSSANGTDLTATLRAKLAARSARYWRSMPAGHNHADAAAAAAAAAVVSSSSSADGAGSSRTGALLRAAAEGWDTQDSADGSAVGAVAPKRSATAQDLAAKLDALEVDWQGYKRNAAAAAASGSGRRSMSGGGTGMNAGRSSSCSRSVPASPRDFRPSSRRGISAAGNVGGTEASRLMLQQPPRTNGRRASLSANNSPISHAPLSAFGTRAEPFWAHQQEASAISPGGAGTEGDGGHDGQQQQQQQKQMSLLRRSIGSFFKMARGSGAATRESQNDDADPVAKSLTFLDDDEQPGTAASPLPSPHGSNGSSPERLGISRSNGQPQQDRQQKSWRGRKQQQQQAGSTCSSASGNLGPNLSGPAVSATPGQQASEAEEEFFVLDDSDTADGKSKSRHAGGASCHRGSESSPHMELDDEGDDDADDFDDDEEEEDDEDDDPSYDPVLHATPAAGRRGSRQAGCNSRSSRTSCASSEPDGASPAGKSRAGSHGGRRSSSQQQQQAAKAVGVPPPPPPQQQPPQARSLAAQVSFNHEKRQGWEKPVLEDINARRAGQGLAPVDKLTIQLLKEHMVGQELDGRPWAPGNKTKDILIADYRRILQLSSEDDEETSINRITGSANWPMPSTSGTRAASVPSSPQPSCNFGVGSWAAAVRRGAESETASASKPAGTMGARRVVSTSLPPSPSSQDTYRAGMLAGSPLRVLQAPSSKPPLGGGPSRTGSPPLTLFGKGGSPPKAPSPRVAPSPRPASSPHIAPSPAGREGRDWRAASPAASPRYFSGSGVTGGSGSGSRSGQGGRSLSGVLSQSVDGSLMLQSGAAREQQQAQAGGRQQLAQRTLRNSGSTNKLKVVIPNSSRIDGPYSARPSTVGSTERTSSGNQPNWR